MGERSRKKAGQVKTFSVTFGETTKTFTVNGSAELGIDLTSILISARAEQIMTERKVDFGEALKRARQEMSDDELRPRIVKLDNKWIEVEFGEAKIVKRG
jgi:hypothetical protein